MKYLKMNGKLNYLLSAYSVKPYAGSEPGLGWYWLKELVKQKYKVFLVTESEFQKELDDWIKHEKIENIEILYVSIGKLGRRLCWNQGSWIFYLFYRIWQFKAFLISLHKWRKIDFKFIHHLNMIGYRELGFQWMRRGIKILGPLGGMNRVSDGFDKSFKSKIIRKLKHNLNFISFYDPFVLKALKQSNFILAANSESQYELNRRGFNPILLNETGVDDYSEYNSEKKDYDIIFVGKLVERKQPDLFIEVVKKISKHNKDIKSLIIGDGPLLETLQNQIKTEKLPIELRIKVDRSEVLRCMGKSKIMLFPSIDEGTPWVVLEALSVGIPVLSHDCCGMADIIDKEFLISPISFENSVIEFSSLVLKTFKSTNFKYNISKHFWRKKIDNFISMIDND
jgi:glycosyltransferase involved in cell wall biosynthesis